MYVYTEKIIIFIIYVIFNKMRRRQNKSRGNFNKTSYCYEQILNDSFMAGTQWFLALHVDSLDELR